MNKVSNNKKASNHLCMIYAADTYESGDTFLVDKYGTQWKVMSYSLKELTIKKYGSSRIRTFKAGQFCLWSIRKELLPIKTS